MIQFLDNHLNFLPLKGKIFVLSAYVGLCFAIVVGGIGSLAYLDWTLMWGFCARLTFGIVTAVCYFSLASD